MQEDCEHCFHETGIMLTSNPPNPHKMEFVCCLCGEKKSIHYLWFNVLADEGKHGPYKPKAYNI